MENRQHLGDRLYPVSPIWQQGEQHLGTLANIRHGHGEGEDLTYWHRSDEEKAWRKRLIAPEHKPAMISIVPLGADSTLLLYVDRRDDQQRRVYLVRADGENQTTLFEFGDGHGVLNPHIDPLPDGRYHLLIPNRNGRAVRRFIIDAHSGESERLPDVVTPRKGARIYDRLVDGNRLIVPLAVVNELLLLVIDLQNHEATIHSLDRFSSVGQEPPRMMRIFKNSANESYVITYLRPADFSDRHGRKGPKTGLLGEVVVNIVSAETYESLAKTVVAGHEPGRAATHNITAAQINPAEIVVAHTEVNRIHQHHLTGEHKNYVGAYLSHWFIGPDGSLTLQARQKVSPFCSAHLIKGRDGSILFFYNEAKEGDPLFMERWSVAR